MNAEALEAATDVVYKLAGEAKEYNTPYLILIAN